MQKPYKAAARAYVLGWRISPEGAPEQPHPWQQACECAKLREQTRFCPCPCHGRGGQILIEEP